MKSILIVEDDPAIILFYKKVLADSNKWNVTFSESFYESLVLLEDNVYDYVISDGNVREESMNGFEFLEKVKTSSPKMFRFLISGTIYPENNDYSTFHVFIDKQKLNGKELLEILDYLCYEDNDLPEHLYSNIIIGYSS